MSGDKKKRRVCIIGAGPSGMSLLYQHSSLKADDKPEVVVYEKQDTWGGQWNLTWRTGTDEYGELNHGSRWTKDSDANLKEYIRFNHAVRYVTYDKNKEEFHVSVADLRTQTIIEETFSHVIVAVGIFSSPNQPYIAGIETFHGRVLHSHDFRSAAEFKGQRVLTVGGNISAEDIAMMCLKYGAKSVTSSWHKTPMGFKWPLCGNERPPIKHVSATTVVFEDDTSAEFDAIILCTGYLCKFPFLENSLQLISHYSMYPDNLYKGIVWMNGGERKLFYMGVHKNVFVFQWCEAQATWIWRYILGILQKEPKQSTEMKADIKTWLKKLASHRDEIDFQAAYVQDLVEMTGIENVVPKVRSMIHSLLQDKVDNLATFRDKCYTSLYTGQTAVEAPKWMTNFEHDQFE